MAESYFEYAEIFHSLSLEACILSEHMTNLLEKGDRADLAYRVKKNEYVFLDSVLEDYVRK